MKGLDSLNGSCSCGSVVDDLVCVNAGTQSGCGVLRSVAEVEGCQGLTGACCIDGSQCLGYSYSGQIER